MKNIVLFYLLICFVWCAGCAADGGFGSYQMDTESDTELEDTESAKEDTQSSELDSEPDDTLPEIDPVKLFLGCEGDFDQNGTVDDRDVDILIAYYEKCPPEGDCPWDHDGDRIVRFVDLTEQLGLHGECTEASTYNDNYQIVSNEECDGDFNFDGSIDDVDVARLEAYYGACPTGGTCPWDLDGDLSVDFTDLTELLGAFGSCL